MARRNKININTNCLFDLLQGRKKIIFTYTNLALKNFLFFNTTTLYYLKQLTHWTYCLTDCGRHYFAWQTEQATVAVRQEFSLLFGFIQLIQIEMGQLQVWTANLGPDWVTRLGNHHKQLKDSNLSIWSSYKKFYILPNQTIVRSI